MSTEKNGIKFFTIFLIITSIYYSIKIYSSREKEEELNKYFEISNLTTTFGKKDEFKHGSLGPNGNIKTDYNVPYIHIKAQIKNLTGDDIEMAELIPELKIEFKYGLKTFNTYERQITSYNKAWKSNESINIDEIIMLTSYDDENNLTVKFIEHNPEKVELNLSIKASNSVGMNMNELIFNKEINSWNSN